MKIISWNINSLRARLDLLSELIKAEAPDVVLLQETKVTDQDFPKEFFDEMGYHVVFWGQKSYNGVAIASRYPLTDVLHKDFGQGARYLEGKTQGVRVISLYVVNGQSLTSPAYEEKLTFMAQVKEHVRPYLSEPISTVIGGDFNVAPYERDVCDPGAWQDSILFSLKERESLRSWFYQGWHDSADQGNTFTWWPYQGRAWEKDQGLRIDFILTSPWGSDRLSEAGVLREWRGRNKPSDHAPVWVDVKVSN